MNILLSRTQMAILDPKYKSKRQDVIVLMTISNKSHGATFVGSSARGQ